MKWYAIVMWHQVYLITFNRFSLSQIFRRFSHPFILFQNIYLPSSVSVYAWIRLLYWEMIALVSTELRTDCYSSSQITIISSIFCMCTGKYFMVHIHRENEQRIWKKNIFIFSLFLLLTLLNTEALCIFCKMFSKWSTYLE